MKQRYTAAWGALVGGASAIGIIGLTYLGDQLADLPFLPFDLFDWIGRVLPGTLVTTGIDAVAGTARSLELGSTGTVAKTIEQLMALGLFVLLGILMGLLIGVVGRTNRTGWWGGALIGFFVYLGVAAAEYDLGFVDGVVDYLWLALVVIGWGAVIGWTLARTPTTTAAAHRDLQQTERQQTQRQQVVRQDRRRVVTVAGSSVAVALVAWLTGRWSTGDSATPSTAGTAPATSTAPTATVAPTSAAAADAPPTATAVARIEPAPGTRPEVTPPGEFYRIDINTRPIEIERADWTLEVAGLFDNPRNLTLDDLLAFPAVTQAVTMRCISNPIGGDLISTAYWTGPRMVDVLEELGLQAMAQELSIEAADGFYESVEMADLMDERTLLVHTMNGEPLPERHGYPLRIYIPNRYGMKQPKWMTRMEAIGNEGEGYWVDRGWNADAIPHITSVIDTVATDQPTAAGTIPVGGIAWAGARGIQQVEVQIDDGEWIEAELRVPPLSQLTWVQWRYNWAASAGEHRLRVRATDGTGTLQTAEETSVRPDGATGYHEVTTVI